MSFLLPDVPGSYRWYYFDITDGDQTAVAIFMLGSLFSPRYSKRPLNPLSHCAINFARYKNGSCQEWILSEYSSASLENDSSVLRIGNSSLVALDDRSYVVSIDEKTPWFSKSVNVRLTLTPKCQIGTLVPLDQQLNHGWIPYAPFASATLSSRGTILFSGRGYHDGNAGQTRLGTDLTSWQWSRTHSASETEVNYFLGNGTSFSLRAGEGAATFKWNAASVADQEKTRWGLMVPKRLGEKSPTLLESSPFYARLEAHTARGHVLHEVADFKKFNQPHIRFLANFRTRYEGTLK